MSDRVEKILEERNKQWGNADEQMRAVAKVWSGIFGFEVKPIQVPLAMAGYKLVRANANPTIRDSFDDVHGYTDIAENMVCMPQPTPAIPEGGCHVIFTNVPSND